MSRFAKFLLVSSAVTALAACSSGAGGPVQPTLNPDGTVAPPRNLQLIDLSYLHPSNDGVDETYDVSAVVANFTTAANGANTVDTIDRQGFGAGNTMFYDASANTFTFDVTTENASLQETFGRILLANPVSVEAGAAFEPRVVWATVDPARFGLNPALAGDPAAVAAAIDALSSAEQDAIDALVDLLEDATDYISYNSNGTDYFQLKLANSAVTTYYTTLGLWETSTGGNSSVGAVVFGQRTPSFDIPRTGSVNYNGTIGGYLILENTVHYMTGGANFAFNFTTNNINFTLSSEVGEVGIGGGAVFFDYDTFTGTGILDGATFSGTFTSDTTPDLTGDLDGAFFGISAEEVGGNFEFGNENVSGIGGFVAAREGGTPSSSN
jgi:hypothetical protein